MIVCHCGVVSSTELREAIAAGAGDVCALAEACGAGRACGGCLPVVRSYLAENGLPVDEDLDAREIRTVLRARLCPGSTGVTPSGAVVSG